MPPTRSPRQEACMNQNKGSQTVEAYGTVLRQFQLHLSDFAFLVPTYPRPLCGLLAPLTGFLSGPGNETSLSSHSSHNSQGSLFLKEFATPSSLLCAVNLSCLSSWPMGRSESACLHICCLVHFLRLSLTPRTDTILIITVLLASSKPPYKSKCRVH